MINQKVLVSGAEYFSNDAHINPYYTNDQINRDKAIAEHAKIIECFKRANIKVVKVDPPAGCQDGVYTANWAIVKNGIAIMSRLPKVRQAEQPYAKQVLENLGIKCIELPEDCLFSGQGDSLICGKYLLAGSGYRSDPPAQQFVAKTLGLDLVQLRAVPQLDASVKPFINPVTNHADSFFYDLDLALAVINDHTIAYCPDAFVEESQKILQNLDLDKIIVDKEEVIEGFACNLVSTGKTIIMSARAPKFKAELESRGFTTLTPDVTELKKGGGYIRCISLTLD